MLIAEAPNRSNIDKRVIGFPSVSTAILSVCEAVIVAILFQNPASTANIFSSVSFHYFGEICDFTSRTKEGLSGGNTPGTISLHDKGRKVIDVEILQNDMPDQFGFGELNTFNLTPLLLTDIVSIAASQFTHEKSPGNNPGLSFSNRRLVGHLGLKQVEHLKAINT